MAEAFNSLFKAELIRNHRPWKNIDDLEIAVAEYIDYAMQSRMASRQIATVFSTPNRARHKVAFCQVPGLMEALNSR